MKKAVAILWLFAATSVHGLAQPACLITIGIGRDGTPFSNRFHGWYRVTVKTLQSDLRGGCYNDANPIQVTSVELEIAPGTPKTTVDSVLLILKKEGWSKAKVGVETWDQFPLSPK